MPEIQQDQLSVANILYQRSNNTIGNKRSSQRNIKKKKTKVKFQKTNHTTSVSVQPKTYNNSKSPFTTKKSWIDFIKGKCPIHSKSEYGFTITGDNWYWCKYCKQYTKTHNSNGHSSCEPADNGYTPQPATATAIIPKASPPLDKANVASAPDIPAQTQE